MTQLYDIYFAGRLVEDFEAATVRENLARLFKANDAALDKLFSGKPQPIKRGVDKPAAIKYKAAMARAGAVALVTAQPAAATKVAPASTFDDDLPSIGDIKPAAAPKQGGTMADRIAALAGEPGDGVPYQRVASTPAAGTPAAGTPAAGSADSTNMTLAPAGSAVLTEDEREVMPAQDIDTSAIHLAPELPEPESPRAHAPPAPDTSHLSMGEVGEDIPHLEIEQTLLDPDISHLSMGAVGEDIPHLEIEQELLDPDTSGISLSPEGSEVLEEQYKHRDETPAPSTAHLALEDQTG